MIVRARHGMRLLACALLVLAGCGRGDDDAARRHSAALAALFAEDQADRARPLEEVDTAALARGDSVRRVRVRALADAGALRTADDFYHAAMVFQHGRDSAAYRQAHQWARAAERLDPGAEHVRWLVAASWDRLQRSRGRPQWYGTQPDRLDGGAGPVVLYAIDTTRVTDAERVRRGVGTLASLCARLDTLNAGLGQRADFCF